LILCAEKNEAIARYSILHEHKQLFAAKYVTYLPSVEELEHELERERRIAEAIVESPRATATTKRTPHEGAQKAMNVRRRRGLLERVGQPSRANRG